MDAAKELEEESSAKNTDETVSKNKKHALLQWKKRKRKQKKAHKKEIILENFENEALKFNQKASEHAQRKGQDSVKAISVNSSKSSLAKPVLQDKVDIKLEDEEKEEEEEEFDTNKMWAALEKQLNAPRTAVACTNLAQNTVLKGFGKRRPKKFKNIRAARAFRAACRRKLLDGEDSPIAFSGDSTNEDEQDEDVFSLSSPAVQPFTHVFSGPDGNYFNTTTLELQQPNPTDKWVHCVLTIPMFNQEPQLSTADDKVPSTFDAKSSQEKANESARSIEENIIEFGEVDCDRESKAFLGQPKKYAEEHFIQDPPNTVPYKLHKFKSPIRHHHCINDDPFTDQERGLEHIVSQGIVGLSKLIRRHNRTLDQQEQLGTLLWPLANSQTRRDGPRENHPAVYPSADPISAFNALVDSVDRL